MQFTFVEHNGPRPEKAGLVKSHLMKESQKKRRLAKAARELEQRIAEWTYGSEVVLPAPLPNWLIPHPASFTSHYASLSNQEQEDQMTATRHRDQTERAWKPSVPFRGRPLLPADLWCSVAGADRSRSHEHYQDVTDDSPLDSGQLHDTYARNHILYGRLPRLEPRLCAQPSLTPHFAHETDSDHQPVISTALFLLMSDLMSKYANPLELEVPGLQRVSLFRTYWIQEASLKPKLLLSYCLLCCAHRDMFRNTPGDDHYYFKGRTLRLINESLADPRTATADDTFGTILSLTLYEIISGTEHVSVHLKGLRRMADIRGGIDQLMGPQQKFLGEIISIQHIAYTVCNNIGSIVLDIDRPILRDFQWSTVYEAFCTDSPLRLTSSPEAIKRQTRLRDISPLLFDAFDGFETLCNEVFEPEASAKGDERSTASRDSFWERLNDLGELDEMVIWDQRTTQGARELIRLAARIQFRAVALKVQHDDPLNEWDMRRLHSILKTLDWSMWARAHYVHFWILLTGGAAAHRYPHERSFFVTELVNMGLTVGLFEWSAFRQTSANFLWLQDHLRKSKPVSDAHRYATPQHEREQVDLPLR